MVATNNKFIAFAQNIYDIENVEPKDRLTTAKKVFHHKKYTRIFEGEGETIDLESAVRLIIQKQCTAVYLKIDTIFLEMTVSSIGLDSTRYDVYLNDISKVLKLQKSIYEDLIESNFSHECMTPLNLILSHSESLTTNINNQRRNFQ